MESMWVFGGSLGWYIGRYVDLDSSAGVGSAYVILYLSFMVDLI